MLIESVLKEPDLWAECIKNLVTVASLPNFNALLLFPFKRPKPC